jgi:hypothetical protein
LLLLQQQSDYLTSKDKNAIVMSLQGQQLLLQMLAIVLAKQAKYNIGTAMLVDVTKVNMDDIASLRYLREVYFSSRIMQYQQ